MGQEKSKNGNFRPNFQTLRKNTSFSNFLKIASFIVCYNTIDTGCAVIVFNFQILPFCLLLCFTFLFLTRSPCLSNQYFFCKDLQRMGLVWISSPCNVVFGDIWFYLRPAASGTTLWGPKWGGSQNTWVGFWGFWVNIHVTRDNMDYISIFHSRVKRI